MLCESAIYFMLPVIIDFMDNCNILKSEGVVITRGCPPCQDSYVSLHIPLTPPFSKGELW